MKILLNGIPQSKKWNNVYKIKNKEVNYYELWGQTYQFDEIFELWIDIEEDYFDNAKLYNAAMSQYPDGRMPRIVTIEMIYNGLKNNEFSNPSLNIVKGHDPYIKDGDIKLTKGIFNPKILLFLADELNELMNSEDYKSTDAVKQALGSIARLGRAAGCHLALAMQRASSGTVNADLMNNIQQAILLGAFDSGTSSMLFEKDISNLAKPKIKGRAFMQVGKKDIFEVQTYFTQPKNDWVFDEERRDTYINPEYQEQKFGKVLTQDEVDELLIKNGFKTDTQMELEKNMKNDEAVKELEKESDDFDDLDDFDDFDEKIPDDIEDFTANFEADLNKEVQKMYTDDGQLKELNGTFKQNEEAVVNKTINFIEEVEETTVQEEKKIVQQMFVDEE